MGWIWVGYVLGKPRMQITRTRMCILENTAAYYIIRIYIALQHSSRLLIAKHKERDVVTRHVYVFASCMLLASAQVCLWPLPI